MLFGYYRLYLMPKTDLNIKNNLPLPDINKLKKSCGNIS